MWIKSLNNDTWVSMKHVTHFSVQTERVVRESVITSIYVAYAYLNADSLRSSYGLDDILRGRQRPEQPTVVDQARIPVCQGSKEKCEQFVVEQQLLESAFQWIGYLVAGGVGAVLTLIFT